MKKLHLIEMFCGWLALMMLPSAVHAHDTVVVVPLGGSKAKNERKTFTKNIPAAEFRVGFKYPDVGIGFDYDLGHNFKISNSSMVSVINYISFEDRRKAI